MTREDVGWSVVHVTVAPVVVMLVTVTALISGVVAVVVNVEFADVADKLVALADTTSKL